MRYLIMNDTTTVLVNCMACGTDVGIKVLTADLQAWEDGALAQDCFPYLSPDMRELLISQTCPNCWDSMFGSE